MTQLLEVLEYSIAELGSLEPKYVLKTDNVQKAVNLMRENKTGCCLVIDENINLCGIITERDILNYIVDKQENLKKAVSEFMTKDPQSVKANESIVIALQMMSNGNFRNLPVVNMDNKPVGMISISDIMKFFTNHIR